MTKDELSQQLASTFGKTKVNKLVIILKERHFSLHDLIDFTFHHDKTIAFRAAWLLENYFLSRAEVSHAVISFLLSRFTAVVHPSCQRHYVKTIMYLTSDKAQKDMYFKLAEINLEPVVEKCFDWLIDPQILVAVKVHAAETLFHMRLRYPWIPEELACQLHFLMREGSAGMQSRGKKLLTLLGNQK